MTRLSTTVAVVLLAAFTVVHFIFLRYALRQVVSLFITDETRKMKVYVYDVPKELLRGDLGVTKSSCHLDFYSVEMVLPELVKQSRWGLNITQIADAAAADYFVVPHYSICYYHECRRNETASVEECQARVSEYMTKILDYVEGSYPFWQRRRGRDHLFVLTWDWGVHIFGEQDESVIRNRLSNGIHLTLLGMDKRDYRNVFDPAKDISIPPLRDYNFAKYLPRPSTRAIFAYFRGTFSEDLRYSNGIRQRLQKYGTDDPAHYFIRAGHSDFYWHELVNARYAICPAGWSHWSPRLFDAIVAGAIPVIIADEWRPAFDGVFMKYGDFAVRVPEKDIERLTEVLMEIPPEREAKMRANLAQIAHRFVYNSIPQTDDALDSIMQILSKRPVPEIAKPIIDLGSASDGEYSDNEDGARIQSEDNDDDLINDEL